MPARKGNYGVGCASLEKPCDSPRFHDHLHRCWQAMPMLLDTASNGAAAALRTCRSEDARSVHPTRPKTQTGSRSEVPCVRADLTRRRTAISLAAKRAASECGHLRAKDSRGHSIAPLLRRQVTPCNDKTHTHSDLVRPRWPAGTLWLRLAYDSRA